MRYLSIHGVQKMHLSQPGAFQRRFEIHAGGNPIAALSFDSAFGSRASGECEGGSWTFKQTGFFKTRITVRRTGSESEVALFQNNTWTEGGTLTFPDGRRFTGSTKGRETDLQFDTETGDAVISFRSGGHFKLAVEIDVFRRPRELPVLLLLGCYVIVMRQEESATGAAAATIAAMA